jgi:hypothetical protein
MGSGERMSIFSNFCPEVSFDSFGYFATFLSRYADELDTDMAHESLGQQHADVNDWRWQWSRIIPMHYSACPLYSVLTKRQAIPKPSLSEFVIALLCNMLATALLWAIPSNLSNLGKSVVVTLLLLLSAFLLYFRALRGAGKLVFWSASALLLVLVAAGVGAEEWAPSLLYKSPVTINPHKAVFPSTLLHANYIFTITNNSEADVYSVQTKFLIDRNVGSHDFLFEIPGSSLKPIIEGSNLADIRAIRCKTAKGFPLLIFEIYRMTPHETREISFTHHEGAPATITADTVYFSEVSVPRIGETGKMTADFHYPGEPVTCNGALAIGVDKPLPQINVTVETKKAD